MGISYWPLSHGKSRNKYNETPFHQNINMLGKPNPVLLNSEMTDLRML